MRHLEREFGGKTRTFNATMKASFEISESVADPLQIMREASLEMVMHQQGIPYTPRIDFDTMTVCKILWVGLKHSTDKDDRMALDDVKEAAFDMGWVEAKNLASSYLALITTPKPSAMPTGDGNSDGDATGN